jgi:hypothetical protein
MVEPIQDENEVQEFHFGRLTVPELRAELRRYRDRWSRGQIPWRVLKAAEKALRSEIKFRESDPIE